MLLGWQLALANPTIGGLFHGVTLANPQGLSSPARAPVGMSVDVASLLELLELHSSGRCFHLWCQVTSTGGCIPAPPPPPSGGSFLEVQRFPPSGHLEASYGPLLCMMLSQRLPLLWHETVVRQCTLPWC